MFDQRMMLHTTLQIGDRKVDVVDTHLTLLDAPGNTQNLVELRKTLEGLEAQGRTVIAAGDMNTNFALARGGEADAHGIRATPTDTAAELKDRYGKGPSNIGDAADLKAAQALLAGHNYFWDAANRKVLVDGRALAPEEAQALLDSGKFAKGSAEEKRLQLAVDGATLGGGDRLDNIFASKNVRFTSALIDQSTHASDHRPIFADVRWD
jgi:endonuclease/exonuclease/phosphatase family metal-dependent hydrolase